MRYFLLVSCLFFVFKQSFAASKNGLGLTLTGPDERWLESPLKIEKVKNGWLYGQNFTRYLFEVERPYELGNISYMSVPFNELTKDISTAKEVQIAFSKMFDIKPFVLSQYRGRKNQWMLEGEYKKHGRFIRIIIAKHSNRFSFTTAYLRKPYLESIDYSAAWIQDKLIDREEIFIKTVLMEKKTSFFEFISKVYAVDSSPAVPAGWSSEGGFAVPGKSSSGTFDPITVVKDDGSTFQVQPCKGPGPLPTTQLANCPSPTTCPAPSVQNQTQYQQCLEAISNCRSQQFQDSTNVLRGQIDGIQQDIKCQSDWWSAQMDHYSEEWGQRTDRAIQILEKAFSPMNVASLAAAGVVGASVASFGVGLAIAGIQSGAEALWSIVDGAHAEEKHQEILKIFMENKKNWDQMNEKAMMLATRIDQSIDLLELVKLSGKSLESIIIENKASAVELETQIEDSKEKYQAAKELYHDDETNSCVTDARNEYNKLKKELFILKDQLEKMDQIKKEHGSFENMCSVLNHNLKTLLQLEGDLQNARVLMLRSYDHFQIEESRRRENLRESGRALQIEDARNTYEEEVKKAQESFSAGIASADLKKSVDKAIEACYDAHIKRNGWHNFICRIPIISAVPLLGGLPSEPNSGFQSACHSFHSKCSMADQVENYLYFLSHEDKSEKDTDKRNELIRAHRQFSAIYRTHDSDVRMARETLEQKLKVKDYLNYNEDTSRAKTEAVHNWMMSLRLEQACSNLPKNCDDKATDLLSSSVVGTRRLDNEIIKKEEVHGKSELRCVCRSEKIKCNCNEVVKSEYFKCRQTKLECDANKQSLICYNLPFCPAKENGDTSHCKEYCPKVTKKCSDSKEGPCLQQKQLADLCETQFKICAEEKMQTGCEIHFSKKCKGSKEFCDDFTKKCEDQSLNRAKFRFDKTRAQADLLRNGACKDLSR